MPTTNDVLARQQLDTLDAAFNGATLEVRTGVAPGPNNAATGTLLGSMTLPNPAFAAASGRTKVKAGTWADPVADASGTIGHVRIISGGLVQEFTASVTDGGGEIQFGSLAAVAGNPITITGFTLNSTNPSS